MDPRNHENFLKKYDEKGLDKLQSRFIFSNPAYQFIVKKTEKISAALYLITNLISDNEPIKQQIRHLSLGMISSVMSLKNTSTVNAKPAIDYVAISISELISLVRIAFISDHISIMNHSVIQNELASLITHLENFNAENINTGVILSQDFFNVPEPVSTTSNVITNNAGTKASKGLYRTNVSIKDNQPSQGQSSSLKDNRKDTITRLLKSGKSLGIKDFATEIKDCSEKTIQRELINLVESGVLKKTGERRWSLYSLA